MRSIREIQQRTIAYFEHYSVPNAKLDTDLIIAHCLGVKRLDLYLDLERPLTDLQLDVLRPLVK
ncbi:MAG: peptide chain release factor N(5)-glutamine methyltransferase, partial [Verrucomicrobiota bacterium]|nr:peptide chain release factor N(5)-glutamine methyltransferase [Verrucomicrobiota bacterium]